MKVYTSRYRTNGPVVIRRGILICLIESPSKKEGKSRLSRRTADVSASLNESPSQKEGK